MMKNIIGGEGEGECWLPMILAETTISLSLSPCSGLWDKYTLTSESTPITSPRYVAAVFKDSESV